MMAGHEGRFPGAILGPRSLVVLTSRCLLPRHLHVRTLSKGLRLWDYLNPVASRGPSGGQCLGRDGRRELFFLGEEAVIGEDLLQDLLAGSEEDGLQPERVAMRGAVGRGGMDIAELCVLLVLHVGVRLAHVALEDGDVVQAELEAADAAGGVDPGLVVVLQVARLVRWEVGQGGSYTHMRTMARAAGAVRRRERRSGVQRLKGAIQRRVTSWERKPALSRRWAGSTNSGTCPAPCVRLSS